MKVNAIANNQYIITSYGQKHVLEFQSYDTIIFSLDYKNEKLYVNSEYKKSKTTNKYLIQALNTYFTGSDFINELYNVITGKTEVDSTKFVSNWDTEIVFCTDHYMEYIL